MIIIQVLSPRLTWTCHNFNPRAVSQDDKLLISCAYVLNMLCGYSSLCHVLCTTLRWVNPYIYLFTSRLKLSRKVQGIVPWISMRPLAIHKQILAGAGGVHLNATFYQFLYKDCPTQPRFDNDTFYYYNYGQHTVIDSDISAQFWCQEVWRINVAYVLTFKIIKR